jgi:hypothetical protein
MPNDSAQIVIHLLRLAPFRAVADLSFSLDHAVNWEAISAIGQLVGALAVVISLIYLAREVRSNARATRIAAGRSTLGFLNRFTQQITEHADLAELRDRGFKDFESLEGADRARFGSYMHAMFRTVEDVYYQHLQGIRIHACGVGSKWSCANLMHLPEFRPGGVHTRIGSMRSLRSSLVSNSKQPNLRRCIVKQIQINDPNQAAPLA